MSDELRAAVAAGVLGAEAEHRSLLQSTVEVARAIFAARASSVFLLDERTDELVFEAVAGEGAETLIGQRFPSSQGVAGWVLVTRQPLIIEDVTEDPRFAKEVAESTLSARRARRNRSSAIAAWFANRPSRSISTSENCERCGRSSTSSTPRARSSCRSGAAISPCGM